MQLRPLAAALLCAAPMVHAEENLEPIIVTASRMAESADETLAPVTVITRDDIERQQAHSINDVLRALPGLSVSNSGGLGKTTSVFLRGTESDHILVLIDGIKVGSATFGTTAFQDIPVEQIERIEIVRGPRSSLYGSEAIGGVIQIFTRRGGGALKQFFRIGGGSHETYDALAGISGGGENSWFNFSVSGIDTEGFNACTDMMGCSTIEPDKDGYRNVSGAARMGYRFENDAEITLSWLRAEGETEFDAPDDFDPVTYAPIERGPNEAHSVQQALGLTGKASLTEDWDATLTLGGSQDYSDNFKAGGVFDSRFNTERRTVSLQNDFTPSLNQLLIIGIDYQDDRVDSTTDYDVDSRITRGLFTQYQMALGAHDLQMALRGDNNEQFGQHNTGEFAWGVPLGEELRLTASYGTAFKAPSFNELYYPGYGNPDLSPETSRSVEFGLEGKISWGRWSLNGYETTIDDLIAHDAAIFAPANIGEARIRGLEATLATSISGWNLKTNITLLNPENRSDGDHRGNVLPRRASEAARVDTDRDFGVYGIGATLIAEGDRYDDVANTQELAGYATLDLRGEYRIANDWRLGARVENLFDQDYQTTAGFAQPERSYYLTLSYRP